MKLRKLLKNLSNTLPKKIGKKQETAAIAIIEEAIESLRESELMCVRGSCSNFALEKSNYCRVHYLAKGLGMNCKKAAKKAYGGGKFGKRRKK